MDTKNYLGERALKAKCIDYILRNYSIDDSVLIDELPFAGGRRRADIVHVNGSMDAFEIKSNADNLSRLAKQIEDYQNCFDTVSVVTTEKHLSSIRKNLSKKVGIFLEEKYKITNIRKAIPFKRFKKYDLAFFINSKDLNPIMKSLGIKNYSKMAIIEKRICLLKFPYQEKLREVAIKSLKQRYKKRFEKILEHRQANTFSKDIPLFWHGYNCFEAMLWNSNTTCSDSLRRHVNIGSN